MDHKEFLDCLVVGLSRGVAPPVGTKASMPCGEYLPKTQSAAEETICNGASKVQVSSRLSLRGLVLGAQGLFSAKLHPCQ